MTKVPRGYLEVQSSCAWRDLSNRGKIRVTGPDRVSFLHALLSNDVESLDDLQGNYSTLLTATGKIIADFYVYRFRDHLLLDISEGFDLQFLETLNAYIIMDDVELSIEKDLGHISIQGPETNQRIREVFDVRVPLQELSLLEIAWSDEQLLIIQKSELSVQGVELIFPLSLKKKLLSSLEFELKMESISDEAYNTLRTEMQIPLIGVDFTPRNNPVEIGLSKAYSLQKGCFVGQEVVSKATYIGKTARKLVSVEIQSKQPVAIGAAINSPEDEGVGKISSVVYSPRLDKQIGFAFIKRDFSEPGTVLFLKENEKTRITVVDRFGGLDS
jgi:folate-binding protein YgfZ